MESAVSYVGRHEEQLKGLTTNRSCRGIICGQLHTPEDKRIGNVPYPNSGDWVESLTTIVETLDRRFEVLGYDTFLGAAGSATPQKQTG